MIQLHSSCSQPNCVPNLSVQNCENVYLLSLSTVRGCWPTDCTGERSYVAVSSGQWHAWHTNVCLKFIFLFKRTERLCVTWVTRPVDMRPDVSLQAVFHFNFIFFHFRPPPPTYNDSASHDSAIEHKHTETYCLTGLLCPAHQFIDTKHYTLHTTQHTLHTTHYTLHATQYILHTTHYILHATHYTLHATHHTLHATHHTLHATHYTLHTTHCTLHATH